VTGLPKLISLAAAAFVAAVAGLAVPTAPAHAAGACPAGAGVTAVVDFGSQGGGMQTGCGGAAKVASDAFKAAGFTLTPHPRQPSFVCQVQGKPADRDCMGTDAYWGFFVDVGKGWVYASLGVYQQAVESGDSVALVWQCSQKQRRPGQALACTAATRTPSPTAGSATATRTPRPKSRPTNHASSALTASVTSAATATPSAPTGSSVASATPTKPSAAAATPTSSAVPTPAPPTGSGTGVTSEASADASTDATTEAATEPAASTDGGGLPGWVPPVIVIVLVAAAGGVAWTRRAR
jgi:hypothetical protein